MAQKSMVPWVVGLGLLGAFMAGVGTGRGSKQAGGVKRPTDMKLGIAGRRRGLRGRR